jgi:transposase
LPKINFLEATHLIHRLAPHGYGKEILRARYKIYMADAAISANVLLKGKSMLEGQAALERAVETAFFKHVFTRYYNVGIGFSYWRGKKEARCDGHIFITVIAYHLMHTIRFKLRHKGVKFCWMTIRRQLSTHVRATTTMKRKDNKVIKIRKSSKTEPAHEVIYDALGLSHRPGRTVKTIL